MDQTRLTSRVRAESEKKSLFIQVSSEWSKMTLKCLTAWQQVFKFLKYTVFLFGFILAFTMLPENLKYFIAVQMLNSEITQK